MAGKNNGKKLRRCNPRSKAYYASVFFNTEKNQRKKLGRHIRSNPTDSQACKRLAAMQSQNVLAGHLSYLTSKGRKVVERASKRLSDPIDSRGKKLDEEAYKRLFSNDAART